MKRPHQGLRNWPVSAKNFAAAYHEQLRALPRRRPGPRHPPTSPFHLMWWPVPAWFVADVWGRGGGLAQWKWFACTDGSLYQEKAPC